MRLCSIAIFSGLACALGGDKSQDVLELPVAGKDNNNDQCPIDIPLSCSNKTEVHDSCCFEYPGGILLQTQFWDYHPPVGPDDMFTLHGLWPDKCDGSYEQFCDDSQNIESAEAVLQKHGETELLAKMKKFWKNFNGNDDMLWVHEFNKHGTCMNTLRPGCYGKFKPDQNIVDFYSRTVEIFEQLPTFKWLEGCGIKPTESATYDRDAIEDCLSKHFGQPVYISCNRYQALQEVWYFHQLKGSVIAGEFVPIPSMLNSRCPLKGIKFLPKTFQPPTPTGSPGNPGNPGKPGQPGGKFIQGFLKPADEPGCIISNGHWYTSGTCATFRLYQAPFGGYNMRSSKGYCAPDATGELFCGPNVTPKQFQYDKETKVVTYGGRKGWSADEIPGKFKQVPITYGKGTISFELKLQ